MEFDPTQATTDTLETELIRLERLIRRARRLQAALVAEADRRQLPTADGARTIIDWVAAKLDVTHTTARQIHTLTHTHLTDPDLSTDRTIALTRLSDAIGTPVEPQDWAGFDLPALHRRIHHHRHATRRLEYDAVEDRFVAIQPNLDSSSWRLWGQLPATDGAVVEQALTSRGDQLVAGLPPDEPRPNRGQSTADALVSIAIDSFDTGESSGTAR